MRYALDFSLRHQQLIKVNLFPIGTGQAQRFCLPVWRPGRYELQRFDKLIADIQATDLEGNLISIQQLDSHRWEVTAEKGKPYTFSYIFYANQRDSGGSAVDENSIYVNTHNLLMLEDGKIEEASTLELQNIPNDVQIACGMKREATTFFAQDYHELIDSPFFIANKTNLKHHTFQVQDLKIHLWFLGDCKPDFPKFENDIRAYTEAQFRVFGDCPVTEYHYLCQIVTNLFRHGVEHQTSSINTFGPGFTLMQTDRYESFLELLSHEFFHTWNVKYLRPADLYPYAYDHPQYSELHYVTEGVTTYYGDLMLLKAGIYSVERFLKNFNMELMDHYSLSGKAHISLAQSSFNSWVNGYGAETGIPNRKISFYTKGFLVAFLLDYHIQSHSENRFSLDDVLYHLYQNIAKNGRGYTKQDFKTVCEEFAGKDLTSFFEDYYDGITPLDAEIKKAAKYFGFSIKYGFMGAETSSAIWGLKLIGNKVEGVMENSPAHLSGIIKGDEIIALNQYKSSLEGIWNYVGNASTLTLTIFRNDQLKQIHMEISENPTHNIPYMTFSSFPIDSADENRQKWVRGRIN